jgi:hypothetical protein
MKKLFLLNCILWLFVGGFWGIAEAVDATMTPPEVDFREHKLLVSSKLDVDLDGRLKEALDSGLEIRFFFTLELNRIRSWWWDENMITMPVVYAVKYDNIKKEYLVGTGKEGNHHTIKDYQKMKEMILQLKKVPLNLPENWDNSSEDKYYLSIMCEMPSFDPQFLFFSSSEFSTPWVESQEFTLPFLPPSSTGVSPKPDNKERAVP